jgi:hypothetical protein
MSKTNFTQVKRGVVKRNNKREVGIFIDGVNLDRASRRINKKIDFAALKLSLSNGLPIKVARYYSVIPNEDDARQHSFFDVIHRAGFEVILKRLPPVGIDRQVTTDVEIASDMIAFAMGISEFEAETQYLPEEILSLKKSEQISDNVQSGESTNSNDLSSISRIVTIVTPGRDLTYPISLASKLGADTITADYASIATGDKMKSAQKWVDLTDADNIYLS